MNKSRSTFFVTKLFFEISVPSSGVDLTLAQTTVAEITRFEPMVYFPSKYTNADGLHYLPRLKIQHYGEKWKCDERRAIRAALFALFAGKGANYTGR